MLAAKFGATDTVQLLLERGADPTIKNIDGRTVIFNAVGHGDIMKIFLTVRMRELHQCTAKVIVKNN